MIKVKDLIELLQKEDPEAIVLYAFNEYGNNGSHGQIVNDRKIAVISKGEEVGGFVNDEDYNLVLTDNDTEEDDYFEEFPKESDWYTWEPAIMLFAA